MVLDIMSSKTVYLDIAIFEEVNSQIVFLVLLTLGLIECLKIMKSG